MHELAQTLTYICRTGLYQLPDVKVVSNCILQIIDLGEVLPLLTNHNISTHSNSIGNCCTDTLNRAPSIDPFLLCALIRRRGSVLTGDLAHQNHCPNYPAFVRQVSDTKSTTENSRTRTLSRSQPPSTPPLPPPFPDDDEEERGVSHVRNRGRNCPSDDIPCSGSAPMSDRSDIHTLPCPRALFAGLSRIMGDRDSVFDFNQKAHPSSLLQSQADCARMLTPNQELVEPRPATKSISSPLAPQKIECISTISTTCVYKANSPGNTSSTRPSL